MTTWYVGTFTLIGVTLGVIVGFIVNQPPLSTVLGLGIGAALDAWLHQRSERD
ncbi:MAG: hypothetical protein KJ064_17920 [Anaerolineae bacterium]|nr:hypothetical protein [Anaerolineae bacterium]